MLVTITAMTSATDTINMVRLNRIPDNTDTARNSTSNRTTTHRSFSADGAIRSHNMTVIILIEKTSSCFCIP